MIGNLADRVKRVEWVGDADGGLLNGCKIPNPIQIPSSNDHVSTIAMEVAVMTPVFLGPGLGNGFLVSDFVYTTRFFNHG